MMKRLLPILAALSIGTSAVALTPDELKALVDKRAAAFDPIQALLNDPDPVRSMAAMELMIESGEPHLMQSAVDFGLQSAMPEIRRTAVLGFLRSRPTLLLKVDASQGADEKFEEYFRYATSGTVLPNGAATYSVNVGTFDPDQNCFLRTGSERCAIDVSPTGLSITKVNESNKNYFTRSNLFFSEDGSLTGATSVANVTGSFPTTLRLSD